MVTGDIRGGTFVGGIVGYSSNNSNVISSASSGNIIANSGSVGGILGSSSSYYCIVENCYSIANEKVKVRILQGFVALEVLMQIVISQVRYLVQI